MSWMDYLLAVLVGCAGMLGLFKLAVDVVTLNLEAYEITLATLILAEAIALSRFAGSTVFRYRNGVCHCPIMCATIIAAS